jgi:hypothetical protein
MSISANARKLGKAGGRVPYPEDYLLGSRSTMEIYLGDGSRKEQCNGSVCG